MMNEIICDNILRKFEGTNCLAHENLKKTDFYENIDPDFTVIEDHINFLIRDKSLRDTGAVISLTTKGWFILTNADKVGYVAQRIESARRENYEKDTRILFKWTTLAASAMLITWIANNLMNA